MPPGSTGTYGLQDFATVQAGGSRPAHTDDQEAMYANLVTKAPTLTAAEIATFYKDASFYTDAVNAERVETFAAHPGSVILRDSAFGVPHVFGISRADTEFGSGYTAAEDRLFEMDTLRHVGRAQLTSFIGPSASNEAMDCSVAEAAGYSESELQAQVNAFPSRIPIRSRSTECRPPKASRSSTTPAHTSTA